MSVFVPISTYLVLADGTDVGLDILSFRKIRFYEAPDLFETNTQRTNLSLYRYFVKGFNYIYIDAFCPIPCRVTKKLM